MNAVIEFLKWVPGDVNPWVFYGGFVLCTALCFWPERRKDEPEES